MFACFGYTGIADDWFQVNGWLVWEGLVFLVFFMLLTPSAGEL